MKNVLLVEDLPFVADATREILERSHPDAQVVVCSNAAETREALRNRGDLWSCILLDLGIPGATGLSLAREIFEFKLHTRCCVVTAVDRPEFVREIRQLGFLGYIDKSSPSGDFVAALSAVLEGRASFPIESTSDSERSQPIQLTRRQAEILNLIAKGETSKEIAMELKVTEGTVNTHIKTLMSALRVTKRTHAVSKSLELGLLHLQDCQPPDDN